MKKKEEKAAAKKAEKTSKLTVEIPETKVEVEEIQSSEIQVEEYNDDDEEVKDLNEVLSSDGEEEEEEVEVVKFEHNSVSYLKTAEGILYDEETQDVVGKWNEEMKCIEECEEDSDSEDGG